MQDLGTEECAGELVGVPVPTIGDGSQFGEVPTRKVICSEVTDAGLAYRSAENGEVVAGDVRLVDGVAIDDVLAALLGDLDRRPVGGDVGLLGTVGIDLVATDHVVVRADDLDVAVADGDVVVLLELDVAAPVAADEVPAHRLEGDVEVPVQRRLVAEVLVDRAHALAERTRIAQTEGWLPELTLNAYSVRGASEGGERTWSWGGGFGIEPARVGPDGRFTLAGLHGTVVLRIMGFTREGMAARSVPMPPLKAILHEGRDITDTGLAFQEPATVDVRVVLASRPASRIAALSWSR